MRILTPEQHAQIVDVLKMAAVFNSDNASNYKQALAVLQALPEVEVTAWMRKDTDVMHKTEKRSDYAYTHYYDKPLYATKDKT